MYKKFHKNVHNISEYTFQHAGKHGNITELKREVTHTDMYKGPNI